jgi:hypothetical protein
MRLKKKLRFLVAAGVARLKIPPCPKAVTIEYIIGIHFMYCSVTTHFGKIAHFKKKNLNCVKS